MPSDTSLFITLITSFPTAMFTVMLGASVVFWLISLLGLFDIDIPDMDVDADFDLDSSGNVFTGLLSKFRLVGLPLALVFTAVSLFAWLISYYAMYFITPLLPADWWHYPVGLALLPVCLYLGAWISGKVLRPLRRLFVQHSKSNRSLLGQTAIVRTARVDAGFGEATLADGGAGLIVKVRTRNGEAFTRGARVVLLEYDAQAHLYYVIGEEAFLDKGV